MRRAVPAAAALGAASVMLGGCGMLQWLGLDDMAGPGKQVAQAEPATGGPDASDGVSGPVTAGGLQLDPQVLDALRGRPSAPPAESLPTPVRPPEAPPRRTAVETAPIVPPADAPPAPVAAPAVPEIADPGATQPERPGLPPPGQAAAAPETPPRPADRPAAVPPRAPDPAQAPAEPATPPQPEILAERPPPETPTAEAPPEGRRVEGPAAPPAEDAAPPDPSPEAAPPEPVDEAAPPPPDEQPQLAARPPESEQLPPPGESVATLPEGDGFRITFEPQSEELTDAAGRLLVGLVERLKSNEDMRLQIRAYAGGTPESASQARRLSLARALRIRTFLIDRGIRSTRIDLRALGNTAPQPPADRVDLLLSS